jgi:hypothetical protein
VSVLPDACPFCPMRVRSADACPFCPSVLPRDACPFCRAMHVRSAYALVKGSFWKWQIFVQSSMRLLSDERVET